MSSPNKERHPTSPLNRDQVSNKKPKVFKKLNEEEIEAHRQYFRSLKKNEHQTAVELETPSNFTQPPSESEVSAKHIVNLYNLMNNLHREIITMKSDSNNQNDEILVEVECIKASLSDYNHNDIKQTKLNEEITSKIKKMEELYERLNQDIEDLHHRLTELQPSVKAISKKMETFSNDTNKKIKDLRELVENMKEDLQTKDIESDTQIFAEIIKMEVEGTEKKIAVLKKTLTTIQEQLQQIETNTDIKLQGIDENMEKLQKDVNKKATKVCDHRSDTSGINAKLRRNTEILDELKESMDEWEGKFKDLKNVDENVAALSLSMNKIRMAHNTIENHELLLEMNAKDIKLLKEKDINPITGDITRLYEVVQKLEEKIKLCHQSVKEVAREVLDAKTCKEILQQIEEVQIADTKQKNEMKRMIKDTKNELDTIRKDMIPEKNGKVESLIRNIPTKSEIQDIQYKQTTLEKALDSIRKDSKDNKKLILDIISSDYDSEGSRKKVIANKGKKVQKENYTYKRSDKVEEEKEAIIAKNKEEPVTYTYRKTYVPKTQIVPKQEESKDKRKFFPYRIPYDGQILEITASEILEFEGNLKEATKHIKLRDATEQESYFTEIQIRWKNQILHPTEEELIQGKGNLDKVREIILRKEDGEERVLPAPERLSSMRKRKFDDIESKDQNPTSETIVTSTLKKTKVSLEKPQSFFQKEGDRK